MSFLYRCEGVLREPSALRVINNKIIEFGRIGKSEVTVSVGSSNYSKTLANCYYYCCVDVC